MHYLILVNLVLVLLSMYHPAVPGCTHIRSTVRPRKSIKVNWLLLWEITPIPYLAGPHSQGDLRDVPADSELTKNDRHKR